MPIQINAFLKSMLKARSMNFSIMKGFVPYSFPKREVIGQPQGLSLELSPPTFESLADC